MVNIYLYAYPETYIKWNFSLKSFRKITMYFKKWTTVKIEE